MRAENGQLGSQSIVLERLLAPGPWADVASQDARARPTIRSCTTIKDTVVLAAVVEARLERQ